MSTTTIPIPKEIRDELKKVGDMDDDYNSVIEKLLREHNRNQLIEYSRKVVEESKKDFVSLGEL